MPSLADRQRGFADALLDPVAPLPDGTSAPGGEYPVDRFAVYRNNVAVGLIEALRSGFPVVDALVGEEFFSAMARAHARASPPASPVLLGYGGDFADFVGGFEPARDIPYLADVARLEWAWLESYHAAEAEPVTIHAIADIAPDQAPLLALELHPSVRLLAFAMPALTIWHRHQDDAAPDAIEIDDRAQYALIVRPHAEVNVIEVTAATFALLTALERGEMIATAVEVALAIEPDADIAAMLAGMFAAGCVIDVIGQPVAPTVTDDR